MHVSDKRVVEHLKIDSEFSLWWMSMIAEKSLFKSRAPGDSLKLLAVYDLLKAKGPLKVELVTSNNNLSFALKNMCMRLDINFKYRIIREKYFHFKIKTLLKNMPYIIKSPIHLLIYFVLRIPTTISKKYAWNNQKNVISIISYFDNIDKKSFKKNEFYSKYWHILPKIIHQKGIKINWLHHYIKTPLTSNSFSANSFIKRLNENQSRQGDVHRLIDSYISIRLIIKTILRWLKIVIHMNRFRNEILREIKKLKYGWLWYLLNDDWNNSIYGPVGITNLLRFYLFDDAIKSIPDTKMVLYLCENQGWERGFLYCWKKYNKGSSIAIAHSTIRYWDLRYCDDLRNFGSTDLFRQPMPDYFAVNGSLAKKVYMEANQRIKTLIDVEALRYLHLSKNISIPKKSNYLQSPYYNKYSKVLILGDIIKSTTNSMMKTLVESRDLFVGKTLGLKSHPNNQINIKKYSKLNLIYEDTTLNDLFTKYDLVIVSVFSSSGLEAYCAGLPVFNFLDKNNLNLSPLKGEKTVKFFGNMEQLKDLLIDNESIAPTSQNYFFLNKELPRYQRLINKYYKL